MRPINFTLGPGSEDTISQAGDKVFVYELPNTASLTIVIEDNDQNIRSFANQGTKIYAQPFSNITIRNEGATSISGQLLVGSGDIDIPIPGVVTVVDSQREQTRDAIVFAGQVFQGGVAAQYAMQGVFNPSSSEKNVFIEEIEFKTNASIVCVYGVVNATFGTEIADRLLSLRADNAADDTTKICQLSSATRLLSTSADQMWNKSTVANVPERHQFRRPVMLPPGYGFVFQNESVNTSQTLSIEIFSEGES